MPETNTLTTDPANDPANDPAEDRASDPANAPASVPATEHGHSHDAATGVVVIPPILLVDETDDAVHDDAWAKPRPRTNRRLTFLATALAIILFGIGTFTAGAKFAKKSTATGTGRAGAFGGLAGGLGGLAGGLGGLAGAGGGFGGAGFGGGRAGRNGGTGSTSSGATAAGSDALSALLNGTSVGSAAPAVEGKVTAVDATTITVTKDDGTTAVITIDNKATFARRANTTLKDIAVGDRVAANGTVDTAGNVAATDITAGDLPVITADPNATGSDGAGGTANTPTPATGNDLGGLLGG